MSDGSSFSAILHHSPDRLLGISPLGFLAQTLRLNCLDCHDSFGLLGVRPRYSDDWCRHLCHSQSARTAIVDKVPAAKMLAPLWEPRKWHAFGGAAAQWRPYLTACPECLKSSYHSMLFQVPWVNQCPWHRVRTVAQCASCSAPLWRSFQSDAAPFICSCGRDHVHPPLLLSDPEGKSGAREFQIRRYLAWADASRSRRELFGCEDDPRVIEATSGLFVPRGAAWHEGTHGSSRLLFRSSTVKHPATLEQRLSSDALAGLAPTIAHTPEFFLELPREMEGALQRITFSIASKFPPGDFSERERRLLGMPTTDESPRQFSRATVILLAAYAVHGRLFFDGRVLSRSARATLQEIAGAISMRAGDTSRLAAYYRAFSRILFRAYARAAFQVLCEVEYSACKRPPPILRPIALTRSRMRRSDVRLLWIPDASEK